MADLPLEKIQVMGPRAQKCWASAMGGNSLLLFRSKFLHLLINYPRYQILLVKNQEAPASGEESREGEKEISSQARKL